MHLRVSTKHKSGKTYQYAQFVESYRRSDGMPAHRVVANLGKLSEREIENFRLALKASREGKPLVLREAPKVEDWRTRVVANLQYLDVAVALETWRRWKLSELFNRLIPKGLDAVASSLVITALVIQRCTDPGSKLYAQRWFPRTALPELLGIELEQFNNTRIHRVLDRLDQVDETLQKELPVRYQQKEGAFATLFMDVTDAWFQGCGPELAERDRTKEGLRNRHKVGIVLVCNEHGYPLRWKVTPGKRRDPQCMEEMISFIQDEGWIGDVPLICDRAMGRATSVAKLVESGIRFLTATTRTEIGSYTERIPCAPFLALSPVGSEITLESEIAVAAQTAEEAGLRKVDDSLYVLDLGVSERTLTFRRPRMEYSGAGWDPDELEGGASFVALARIFQERLNRKEFRSRSELAGKEGLTRARVTQIMNTLRLDDALQERLLCGEFGYVPERLLRECVRYGTEAEQRRLLEEHAQTVKATRQSENRRPPHRTGRQKVQLRLVAYFNPQMFVEQRAIAAGRRQRIEDFVADLNRRLCSRYSHRDKENIQIEVYNELARWKMLKVYEIRIRKVRDKESDKKYWRVNLGFSQEEWDRRQCFAGFVLLVGHHELPYSAEEIARLYREKDTVEKDFQTIKNIVKLRPLYHHTDPKVRAHVSLCMLALLLERTIEHRMKHSGLAKTAAANFEELRNCHLNIVLSDPALDPAYVATEPNQEQRAILRSLRMKDLMDPDQIATKLTARRNSFVVSTQSV